MNPELRDAIRRYRSLGQYSPEGIVEMLKTEYGDALRALVLEDFDWARYLRSQISAVLGDERRAVDAESEAQRLERERVDDEWKRHKEDLKRERYRRRRRNEQWEREGEMRREIRAVELGLAETATWVEIQSVEMQLALDNLRRQAVADFLGDLLVPQAIPGGGWKRRSDLTAEDCLAVAAEYQKRAVTETGMAQLFFAFADAIERQGVRVLGDVDQSQLQEVAYDSASPQGGGESVCAGNAETVSPMELDAGEPDDITPRTPFGI